MSHAQKRAFIFVLFTLYVVLLFIHFNTDYAEFGRDDIDYLVETQSRDFVDWTTHWYNDWSGRISVHTVMYLMHKTGILAWRLVNPLFIFILAYAAARLAFGPTIIKQPGPYFLAAFGLLVLMSTGIFITSTLWLTGSFNYLWSAALGLVAILPFTDNAFHHKPTRPTWYHIGAGIYAALGQEQITVLMLLIMGCAVLILYFRKQLSRSMLLVLALMTTCFLIMFTAPGNAVRLNTESYLLFPGFADFSIVTKLKIGLEFLFEAILTSNTILLLFLFGLLIYGLGKTANSNILASLLIVVFTLACLLIVNFGNGAEHTSELPFYFDHLIEYDPDTHTAYTMINGAFFRTVLLMTLWGSILFVFIPLAMSYLPNVDKSALLINLLIYTCAILSLVIMFFSPTMYASGLRVRYLFTVFLVILILRLIAQILSMETLKHRSVQLISIVAAIVFLLSYYPMLNNYALSAPVTANQVKPNLLQIRCGADQIEIENHYVINLKGWTATPKSALVSGEKMKQLIVVQPAGKEKINTYLAVKQTQTDSSESDEFIPVGVEGKVNLAGFPIGKYNIGFGIMSNKGQLDGMCFLDQIVFIESKWKVIITK